MITCRELIDFLMAYLDEELPADQRELFDAHLEVCPPCQRYLKSYAETVRLGKQAFAPTDDAPPLAVPPSLVEAILAARRTRTTQ
jgi:anti-sigma factor RsiW